MLDRDRERDRERQNGPRFDMSEFPSLSEVVGGAKDAGMAVGLGQSSASHSAVGAGSASVGGGSGANLAAMLSTSCAGRTALTGVLNANRGVPGIVRCGQLNHSAHQTLCSVWRCCAAARWALTPSCAPLPLCWMCQRRPPGGSQIGRGPTSLSSFSSPHSSSNSSSLQQPISTRTQSQPVGHSPSPPSATSTLGGMQPLMSSRGQSLSSKPQSNSTNASNIPSPVASPSVSPSSASHVSLSQLVRSQCVCCVFPVRVVHFVVSVPLRAARSAVRHSNDRSRPQHSGAGH